MSMSRVRDLRNKYFVKRDSSDEWTDATLLFDGVKILSIDGFNELGEAVNVYNEQWIDSQKEDFFVAGERIIRKNVDLSLTFIVGERYSQYPINVQSVHDEFIDYMCKRGDLYIKSAYVEKEAHVICIEKYEPTTQKLHRGGNSYIIGTIKLHTLDEPVSTMQDSDIVKPRPTNE